MAKVVGNYSKDPKDFKPGLYRHYKGSDYRALFIVYHHDTEEAFVVYISYAHPAKIRLREYATEGKDSWTDFVQPEWNEMVWANPVSSSSDGHVYKRFEYIGP